MPKFKTEQELGKKAVEYLKNQKWEVYQEVVCPAGVADIVAVQGHIKWAIECKLSLSLAVIGQAVYHCPYFHYVSIAVPYSNNRSEKSVAVAKQFLRWKGIGLFRFSDSDYSCWHNQPLSLSPNLNRKAMSHRIKLYDEQKDTATAGSANGGHFTLFKRTSSEIQRIVKLNPGIILKDLIEQAGHHYRSDSTAKQCIMHYIKTGIIENITMERDGRFMRFYPAELQNRIAN